MQSKSDAAIIEAKGRQRMHSSCREAIQKDIGVLGTFIAMYCAGKHPARGRSVVRGVGKLSDYINPRGVELCDECAKLFLYAASKRLICPYNPKPACKDCQTHCYGEPHRSKIREIMRYSGMRMILRGSISYIRKFL